MKEGNHSISEVHLKSKGKELLEVTVVGLASEYVLEILVAIAATQTGTRCRVDSS